MRIKLDLDRQTAERLMEEALALRRPIAWQAEIILRRALGLPERFEANEAEGEPCPQ